LAKQLPELLHDGGEQRTAPTQMPEQAGYLLPRSQLVIAKIAADQYNNTNDVHNTVYR
jgi:hypothetical protein